MSFGLFQLDPLGLFDDIFRDEHFFPRSEDEQEETASQESATKSTRGRKRGAAKKPAVAAAKPSASTAVSTTKESKDELSMWRPTMDVVEDDKSFTILAELPGMKKEDVYIDLDDEEGILTIRGERVVEKREERERQRRMERRFGRFIRSLKVPEGIKHDQIQATLRDGVLEVKLPKPKPEKEEEKGSKRIKIM